MKVMNRLWLRRIVLVVATAILLALIIHPVLNALNHSDDPTAE